MSIEARQSLVSNPKITTAGHDSVVGTQRSDLLNTSLTSTWLIAMLQELLDTCAEPIMLTAVRTDHPSPDGIWEHSGGHAADMYPLHWEGREQEAVCAVLKALADNVYCEQVGLGGITQQWESYVTWPSPPSGISFWFMDAPVDHIHASSANPIDQGGGARYDGGNW